MMDDGKGFVFARTGVKGLASERSHLNKLRLYAVYVILAVLVPLCGTASAQILETASLQVARTGHTATLLGNGQVLLVGGASGGAALDTAEVFDPATGAFTAVGSMGTPRTDHAAVLLGDARVLVSGGQNSGGALATSEYFDPATGTFSP